MKIEVLNLSVRAYNCLKRAGINTVGQLNGMSRDDLVKIRNMGPKQAEEVIQKANCLYSRLTGYDWIKTLDADELAHVISRIVAETISVSSGIPLDESDKDLVAKNVESAVSAFMKSPISTPVNTEVGV